MLASVWPKDLNELIHAKCLVWYLVHGKHLRKKHCILLLIIIHIICVAVSLIWVKSLRHQFNRSVVSDSLWHHELQLTRLPCPSPIPGVYPNSCPLSWWCHPTNSTSIVPFSSCPQLVQYQGLFKWVSSSHQVAKVLEFQLQHQSFQWTPRTDLL